MKSGWVVFGSLICGLALWLLASCGGPGSGITSIAPKGAWVSSGGELFKDANNPWFLRNTPVVRYCVAVDKRGISAPEGRVRELITKAIGYWKKQFEIFKTSAEAIAQQNFELVPCSGAEDLRFQIGHGTLSEQQLAYLRDPRQLIGIAVRTSYDEVELRGRGFIFIASDQGPFAYNGDEQFVLRAWSHDGLLYRALAHELGHVFGIPHIGEGLMSAQYPEHILQKSFFKQFEHADELGDFFIPFSQGIRNCQLSANARSWFNVPVWHECIHFTFDVKNDKVARLNILSGTKHEDDERTELGKVEFPLDSVDALRFGLSRGVVIYLNPRQRVFKDEPPGHLVHPGPGFVSLDYAGTFQPHGGRESKPILLKMKASSHEVLGLQDGQIRPLLFWSRNCLAFTPTGSYICLDP